MVMTFQCKVTVERFERHRAFCFSKFEDLFSSYTFNSLRSKKQIIRQYNIEETCFDTFSLI